MGESQDSLPGPSSFFQGQRSDLEPVQPQPPEAANALKGASFGKNREDHLLVMNWEHDLESLNLTKRGLFPRRSGCGVEDSDVTIRSQTRQTDAGQ